MPDLYELSRDETHHVVAWRAQNNACFAHFHSTIELMYVEDGVIHAMQDGVSTAVSRGGLIVNSSYVVHSYATPQRSRVLVATLPLCALPTLQSMLAHSRFAAGIVDTGDMRECRRILSMMADPVHLENERFVNCLGEALLSLLIERVGLVQTASDTQHSLIQNVLIFLQENAALPLTVAQVAAHFGYSEGRFSHLFNEQVGCSFIQYVSSLRCQMARRMLEDNQKSLLEVATACGFSSIRTFHRVYREYTGETPRGRGIQKTAEALPS